MNNQPLGGNEMPRLSPFDHLQVADIGDVPVNTFNLHKSVDIIKSPPVPELPSPVG